MKDAAQSFIDDVHGIWLKNQEIYEAGYVVFYSAPRSRPDLMLIGLNPGGGIESFCVKKEELMALDEEMEYIRYRADPSYPLAVKTVSLFESIGMLDVLGSSLKTNLNFFRSKNWATLPRQHAGKCECLVLEMIAVFEPKAILCEAIGVFDRLHGLMRDRFPSLAFAEVGQQNRRLYASVTNDSSGGPALLAGLTHLTGSRPTTSDVERIKVLIRNDLSKALGRVDKRFPTNQ
jgi:hypothetical protein